MLKHLYLFALLFAANGYAQEQITVPIYDKDRAPLSMKVDDIPRGIYPDLFREILIRAGLAPTLVPIPPMRRRVGFETQLYHLSCCANPAWRKRPKEQEIQIFSKQFYWTKDIFVFPKDQPFKIDKLSKLNDKRVATIRGFDYRGSQHFGERIDFTDEETLIQALTLGRAEVGIVNEDIFNASVLKDKLVAGPIHDEASLHIRIHRARLDLVDPINQAIDQMILSGKRDEIVQTYLQPAQ